MEEAKREIDSSLTEIYSLLRGLGISFEKKPKTTNFANLIENFKCILAAFTICYHCFSDIVFVGILLKEEISIDNIVPYVHTSVYGTISKYFFIFFLNLQIRWLYITN